MDENYVDILLKKAANAATAEEAVTYAQAAENAASALSVVAETK